MSWADLFKSLVFWGPGAVLALAMIYALYKLADKYLCKFVEAQQDQATSLEKLATGAENLRDSINGFVARDRVEHREMNILMKCLLEKFERIEEHIYGS